MKIIYQLIIVNSLLLLLSSCAAISPRIEFVEQKGFPNNEISGWVPRLYSYIGIEHFVYESIKNSKEKPPIILLHQLPGLSKETLEYAQTLTMDFSVYVPLLFGEVFMDSGFDGSFSYVFNSEWHPKENRPIFRWARQLSVDIVNKHPGEELGVIGMCLTGAMPLALLQNKKINSIVVSQPSLPLSLPFFPQTDYSKSSLDLSDSEYSDAIKRTHSGEGEGESEVKILGLRFQNGSIAKREKLTKMKAVFQDAYIDLEICSDESKKHGIRPSEHSVLINAWNEGQKDDHPVNIRRQQVEQFFQARLLKNGKIPIGKSCQPPPNQTF